MLGSGIQVMIWGSAGAARAPQIMTCLGLPNAAMDWVTTERKLKSAVSDRTSSSLISTTVS